MDGLHAERLVAHSGWDGPPMKPWHIVANAKKLIESNPHFCRELDNGATHVWVRYIGYKLLISVYRLDGDDQRIAVDPVIAGKGFWFSKSKVGLYHCMPVKGGLPRVRLTAIANVDY